MLRGMENVLCDFLGNPDLIDHIIPSNDDAIRAIKLITARIAESVLEGLTAREYAAQAALEAEDIEVSAYTETGYIASPDEPSPAAAAAAAAAAEEAAAPTEEAAPPPEPPAEPVAESAPPEPAPPPEEPAS